MSGVPTPADRPLQTPLMVSVIALCALGTFAVSTAPAFAPGFARAFAVAAMLRLVLGRRGDALLPRWLLLPLGYTVSAAAFAYLFQRLGDRGEESLWTLMCITSVFEALVLLWRQTTFSSFLLILFSSVHAAGIAFAHGDAAGLYYIAAYVAALVWTLVVFERRAALERNESDEGSVHRIRAAGGSLLPWRSAATASLLLVFVGLPLGAAVYLAAPRGLPEVFGTPRTKEERADPTGEGGRPGFAAEESRAADTTFAFAGPGGDGAPLGSVAEIKRNFEPWFEVRLADGGGMPPTVILRDNARDAYSINGVWKDTISQGAPERIHRDNDDGERDGWIPLAFAARKRDAVTLQIDVLRGGQSRLFLQPDEVGLELQRRGKALTSISVRENLSKMFELSRPLKQGDRIIQRYVPPKHRDLDLLARRSDEAVAPLVSYLKVPAGVYGPLRARALSVVRAEKDPWRRARLLEAWLKSDAFTYSLKIPRLDRRNPIVDFVERTRTANCEAFAYALTLMLRTLGHPTRYVRGFWGGDRQEQRRSVILRGVHYHAWTEMYLEGAGWVALNPTPPDRRAVDAETQTAAKEAWEEKQTGGSEESWSFLGYDADGWKAFWSGVGARIDRWFLHPVGYLFTREAGWSGWPMALLLVWALGHRRKIRRLKRLVVSPGGSLPKGAYGQALLLLARKGIRRRPTQTVRQYYRYACKHVPAARPALRRLTILHEARCYGGRDTPALRTQAATYLAELRRALRPTATA